MFFFPFQSSSLLWFCQIFVVNEAEAGAGMCVTRQAAAAAAAAAVQFLEQTSFHRAA